MSEPVPPPQRPEAAHCCHAIGCEQRVPPAKLMCYRHWMMVPAALKAAVWRHYRPGQERDKRPTLAYLEAARDAILAVHARESGGMLPFDGV